MDIIPDEPIQTSQIPFDLQGNLVWWPQPGAHYEWRDNKPFTARLRINESFRLEDPETKAAHAMLHPDMTNMIARSVIINGLVNGVWMFVKRKEGYGLMLVEPARMCPCGTDFPESLGKYGCPNCHGDSVKCHDCPDSL
jgi:hypothetical protein